MADFSVDIKAIPDSQEEYYKTAKQQIDCEDGRRGANKLAAGVVSILGLATIYKYVDEYGDARKKRDDIWDKIYASLLADHQYWKDKALDNTLKLYDQIEAYDDLIDSKPISDEDRQYLKRSSNIGIQKMRCVPCETSCDYEIDIYQKAALISTINQVTQNTERRKDARINIKMTAYQSTERSSRNYSTAGRQAMQQSLDIANVMVTMASSGINSGLATLGNGLARLAGGGEINGLQQ